MQEGHTRGLLQDRPYSWKWHFHTLHFLRETRIDAANSSDIWWTFSVLSFDLRRASYDMQRALRRAAAHRRHKENAEANLGLMFRHTILPFNCVLF